MLLTIVFTIQTIIMTFVFSSHVFVLYRLLWVREFDGNQTRYIVVILLIICLMMIIPNTLLLNPYSYQFIRNDFRFFRDFRTSLDQLPLLRFIAFEFVCFGLLNATTLGTSFTCLRLMAIIKQRTKIQILSRPYLVFVPITFGIPSILYIYYTITLWNQISQNTPDVFAVVLEGTAIYIGVCSVFYITTHIIGGIIMLKRESTKEAIYIFIRIFLYGAIFGGTLASLIYYMILINTKPDQMWTQAPLFCLFIDVFASTFPFFAYHFSRPVHKVNRHPQHTFVLPNSQKNSQDTHSLSLSFKF